ncbi:phage holin family protein [Pleurocapsa sp. PCC 7319]|uniref:phage holin family protein n=1 Tax=Pleurocapsa sp. PCC 7319 TaxID=118161 RepID=UPI00034572A8|nr:phage holin family protein [Pleurocapsa sp. PCC 7319]
MNFLAIVISLIVTTISLLIISKLPTGVEVDSIKKGFIAAIVFGVLNALLHPILSFLTLPINFLTFGLFSLIVNGFIFGLAALLVHGFRLRWGIWSALIGAFALSIINSIIYKILPFTVAS